MNAYIEMLLFEVLKIEHFSNKAMFLSLLREILSHFGCSARLRSIKHVEWPIANSFLDFNNRLVEGFLF